jgi:hypothetical protein
VLDQDKQIRRLTDVTLDVDFGGRAGGFPRRTGRHAGRSRCSDLRLLSTA